MKTAKFVILLSAALLCVTSTAHADTFGSGANTFDIDFVTIGNPGNGADTTGIPNPAGSVATTFRMGHFEISEDMINKANTLGSLGISKDTRGIDKPATSVSWFEAAQFVNWLNTSTGSTEAYKFDGRSFQLWQPGDAGYNPSNFYRNSLARYFLPSVDEWYKAAFYNGSTDSYEDYPTANGNVPTAVSSGAAVNTAVYGQSLATGPADITLAGGLSPYGTMGQSGNVYEWEETDFDLVNDSSSSARGVRGGHWGSGHSFSLSSSDRKSNNPTGENNSVIVGFRVASIPEPSTLLLCIVALVAVSGWRKWGG